MTKQLLATPSTKKISDLYTRLSSENPTLILQPAFQRRFVWSSEHKENFIDTLLQGLPIPEIYIAQSGIDIQKIEAQEVVVDGQQRLNTIIQYINETEDSSVFGAIVPKFKDLSETDKRDFLGYNIVVRDLGDISSGEIIEIFKRINSTRYGLTEIELHNAVYDGKFIEVAKEILERIRLSELPFLTESKISRMEDLHFVLLLLSTIVHEGYFSRDSGIEKSIIEFNDYFPNADEITEKFITTFKFIESLNLPVDSIWLRKSSFFTLFVELYKNTNEVENNKLKNELLQLEERILENKNKGKEENDYSLFYTYMYSGTNSRQARVVRGQILEKYLNVV